MRELRHRLRTLIARVRAGEGAHVLADLGETAELWLTSGWVPMPRPLRAPFEQLGSVLGELARAYRPPPSDVPPPSEPDRRAATQAPEERAKAPSAETRAEPTRRAPIEARVEAGATESKTNGKRQDHEVPLAAAPVARARRKSEKPPARPSARPAPAAKPRAKPKSKTGPAKAARHDGGRAAEKPTAVKPAKPERSEERGRVSARRASGKKPQKTQARSEEPRAEVPKRQKGNGKARERRPAARRARDDKTEKPT